MQGKVYIERIADGVIYAETGADGKLVRFLRLSDDDPVGNVYRGKILKVSSSGAFVDIGRDKNAFLSCSGKKPGDFVTVQVARAEDNQKGCLLTEKLSLQGKYVVVTKGEEVRFSRKSVLSDNVKKELKDNVGRGVVFRTAMTENTIPEALAEIDGLRKKLQELSANNNSYNIEILLKSDKFLLAENMSAEKPIEYSISDIADQIAEIDAKRVVVRGVELVFDKTEAMTVIDVNSHNSPDKYTDEEAFAYAVDLVAAEEVSRQLRLRNIGGLIAIDFLNIKSEELRDKLVSRLNTELRKDDVMTKCDFSQRFCVALVSRTKRYGK